MKHILKPKGTPRINRSHTLSRGIVGYWMFNEGSGLNVSDLSGNGYAGTFVYDPEWVTGKFGHAIKFIAGLYYDLGAAVLLSAGSPFSISWWEKMINNNGPYPTRFCLKMSGTTNYFASLRGPDTYGPLSFGPTPSANSIRSVTQPSNESGVGVWRHHVISGNNPNSTNPSDYTYYVDCISYEPTYGGGYGAVTSNRIGWIGANNGTDAILDDVRIYNRIITHSEVKNLYVSPYDFLDTRNNFTYFVTSTPSTGIFNRKTLSPIGSRIGTRQETL